MLEKSSRDGKVDFCFTFLLEHELECILQGLYLKKHWVAMGFPIPVSFSVFSLAKGFLY